MTVIRVTDSGIMNHKPGLCQPGKLSTPSRHPTPRYRKTEQKVRQSWLSSLSPPPKQPTARRPAGNLCSSSLGPEEGSLTWTFEPSIGFIWMDPTNYFINGFINSFINVFINGFISGFIYALVNVFGIAIVDTFSNVFGCLCTRRPTPPDAPSPRPLSA